MELYSMPQLDKSSLAYSDVHYVGRSNLASSGIPVDVKKFSPVTGDILTSSAWSAVIHRPAEDSEPEDLPSTVDMDAIKGSLPAAGPLAWQDGDHGPGLRQDGAGEAGGDDDSESDDDDDSSSDGESSSPNSDGEEADSESGTAQGSASDSDSDSSSQNSYDSDSDSGSSDSSCSSQSSGSSTPSPSPQQFLVRETEKHDAAQDHQNGGVKMKLPPLKSVERKGEESLDDRRNQSVLSNKEEGKADDRKSIIKDDLKESKSTILKDKEKSDDDKRKEKQEVGRISLRTRHQAEKEDGTSREKSKEGLNRSTVAKNSNRKDDENQRKTSISKSKLVSEESLAAILPDVGDASGPANVPFTTFDDGNSHGGRGRRKTLGQPAAPVCAPSSSANESSSDVELPDQVVNDAIQRIQIDSEDKSGTADCADQDNNSDTDSSDAESRRKMYSSSLLQQFVERTERLSGKRNSGASSGGGRGSRRRRVRAVKPRSSSSSATAQVRQPLAPPPPGTNNAGPAELEVYCSVSNVSPDSGIYCVNGSPWHQSSPAHSPQHQKSPPHVLSLTEQRRRTLPLKASASSSKSMKKSKPASGSDRHKDMRVPPIHPLHDSDEEQVAPPSPLAPTRRGPGRPKKAPPVLEPCLPVPVPVPVHPKQSRSVAGPVTGTGACSGVSAGKQRRKDGGSSTPSTDRCDSSTCRGRASVQVQSQGVQCDQSEFRELGLVVKKKKSQGSSRGSKGNHVKFSNSSGTSQKRNKERDRTHRTSTKLQSNSDRAKKKSEIGKTAASALPRPSKSSGSSKEPSSSKRKLPTSVEKRKKGRRKSHAALLAAAAAALLTGSTLDVDRVGGSAPVPPLTARLSKPEKVISLPKGLKSHHKHKKHGRRKRSKSTDPHLNEKRRRSRPVDPIFLSELEKLVVDFQRCCCIARLQVPASRGDGSPSSRLPSIFSVRRIGKKRKGSERSKNSDRDSGPEADTPTPVISAAPRDSRDKGSVGGKRRVKKSTVETPKGQRPETNNEQRLPLKKRHYHLSATPNQQSPSTSSPELSLEVSSSADDKHSNNESPSSISSKSSLISVASQGNSKCCSSVTSGNAASCSATSVSATLVNTVSKSGSQSPIPVKQMPLGTKDSSVADSVSKMSVSISTSCPSPPARDKCDTSSPSILSKVDSVTSFSGILEKADMSSECSVTSKPITIPASSVTKVFSAELPPTVSSSADVAVKHDRMSPETTVPDTSNQLVTQEKASDSSAEIPSVSKPVVTSTVVSTSSKAPIVKDHNKVVTVKTTTSVPALPTPSVSLSIAPVCTAADSSLELGKANVLESQRASATSSPTSTSRADAPPPAPAPVPCSDSLKMKTNAVRDTVDEAIEACISRYACDIPSSSPSVSTRAVITTPKKRHRIELQGKAGSGKNKELEAKRSHSRANSSANAPSASTSTPVSAPAPPPLPALQTKVALSVGGPSSPQALSPGGSKMPESGIFEPSSSSENFVVNVSLPATPVKSAIAGLSKLKGTTSTKTVSSTPKPVDASSSQEPLILTSHNLRQKKGIAPPKDVKETSEIAHESLDGKSAQPPSKSKSRTKSKGKADPVVIKTESEIDPDSIASAASAAVRSKGDLKQDLKEVRIHVEKLAAPKPSLEASGSISKQKARRRKCNRTGFPVKRKKKKKDASPSDNKNGVVRVKSEEVSESSLTESSKTPQTASTPPAETNELRSSTRVQNRKERNCKEGSINIVKVEHKDDNETVISNVEDCPITKGLKNEDEVLEPLDEVSSSTECYNAKDLNPDPVGPASALSTVPTVSRISNKEKYMLCGDKLRKPSKAVIRAMRAKFSENNVAKLPSPSKTGRSKKRARARAGPATWSSDSDDSSESLLPLAVRQELEEAARSERLRSKGRSDMKRPAAGSSCDEQGKLKLSKTDKDDCPTSKVQGDAKARNKRKSESGDRVNPTEARLARNSKRSRTSMRMEADSLESDGDESMSEPLPTPTPCPADVLSEDDLPRIDGKDIKQPRWRKKYLPAGLFSDYYKLDEPRPVGDSKKCLVYKPEDHPHGLLPPPFCEKFLRQKRINFQLPYDLWWLHMHNQLPGRDLVPSWNYKKIRTNVYFNVKPAYMHEPQACNCKEPESGDKGCGDDCINRLVYAECAPGLCPLKDQCSNQRIQRHEWAPGLDRFMTKEKGWGIRTKLPIRTGEFILEYVGEVVSDKEFKERMASRYTRDTHHYCLHLDGGLLIDGHRMGGDGRFVNHSCEPNCEMQKWSVNGLFRMALFALRDIEAMEELGYDYNFSLFNPADGQPCKCGSTQCRGVIGGKSQRVNPAPTAQNASVSKVSVEDASEKKINRKNKRKTCRRKEGDTDRGCGNGSAGAGAGASNAENSRGGAVSASGGGGGGMPVVPSPAESVRQQRKRVETQRFNQLLALNIRPMSHQQRLFVKEHHCFLLRNLEKVKRLKEKLKQATQRPEGYTRPPVNIKQSDVFLTQLNALSTPRNVRTRRLAQAEDDPELARNVRLACILRDLYSAVVTAKDEKGEALSNPFMTLPNKRKVPLYYERIREPLDFSTIEQNINSGLYSTVETFDQDVNRVINNNIRFYGRISNLGIASARLRKIYVDVKKEALPQLTEVLGDALPSSFVAEKNPAEEEDVIRCICGLYRDEGLMIQCERCMVWQHCDCVKADSSFEHYMCEQCQPRKVDLEIVMDPQPSYANEGQTEYVTLLRNDLQIRQGDTVYVLRDVTEGEGESQCKVTYKTIKDPKYADMDIFRIERLWKDDKGERFAYGHHYLRPHETYHEPTRKFYPNEVMRVPLYEIISLDLIWARCWVLDPAIYCKGRPVEAVEEHVYICEYRVDKSAHLFYKISKSQSRANICTKSYAFETFDIRLKPVRTYTPHGPVPPLKPKNRGNQDDCISSKSAQQTAPVDEDEEEMPLARVRDSAMAQKRERQRSHLNGILLRLLSNQQCKQPLDLSYLLEPGRRHRKKPATLST